MSNLMKAQLEKLSQYIFSALIPKLNCKVVWIHIFLRESSLQIWFECIIISEETLKEAFNLSSDENDDMSITCACIVFKLLTCIRPAPLKYSQL